MAEDWRKFEEALVDAFQANGFKPRKSTYALPSEEWQTGAGDWVVHIEVQEQDDDGAPCLTIVETINVTNLAKRLALTLG